MQVKNNLPRRGMDLTNTLETVQPNNYRFANDVELSSHESGEDLAFKRADSMLYLWNTGYQYAKNKTYRITDLYNGDGGSYDITITYKDIDVVVNGTFTNFVVFMTSVQAALVSANITASVNIGYTSPIGSITITGSTDDSVPPYADYIINNTFGITAIVTQEAIDDSKVGSFKPIGGNEFSDYMLQFETTAFFEPLEIKGKEDIIGKRCVIDIQDNGSGLYRFIFGYEDSISLGVPQYVTGQPLIVPSTLYIGRYYEVVISSANINGTWIGRWVDEYTLDIIGSSYTSMSPTSDVSITFYENSCSKIAIYKKEEIGINPKENKYQSALDSIISTQLNFRIQNRINSSYEQNVFGDAFYWVDGLNEPRKIYSNYPNKVFLDINGGDYSITDIANQVKLWKDTSNIGITHQGQFGTGSLKAGNYRYTASLLTELGATESQFLIPTNPILVEDIVNGKPNHFDMGHQGDYVTSKSNQISISGIPSSVYKYAVLYAIRYVEGAIETTRVGQYQLNNDQTEITITHTGNEPTAEIVDTPQTQYISNLYKTASNIDIIENRMILSNLTAVDLDDFTEYFKTVTHSIERKTLTACHIAAQYDFAPQVMDREYNIAENVNNYVGYMPNEIYRIGAMVELLDGRLIPFSFWIDDIAINTLTTNTKLNGDPTSTWSNPLRRTGAGSYITYSLTDEIGATFNPDNIYVPYIKLNFNTDYIINGKAIKSFVKKIHVVRQECVPEILSTGLSVLCDSVGTSGFPYNEYYDTTFAGSQRFVAYRSADEYYQNNYATYKTGDKLINLGIMPISVFNNVYDVAFNMFANVLTDSTTVEEIGINALQFCETGATVPIAGSYFWNVANTSDVYRCNVINLAADITNINSGSSNVALSQIYRPLVDKYGDPTTGNYVFTKNYLEINAATGGSQSADVFGGDTFIGQESLQRNLIKIPLIHSQGILYYNASRVNQRARTSYDPSKTFPCDTDWYNNATFPPIIYNTGYSIYGNNYINYFPAFNADAPYIKKFPTRAIYSAAKPNGSTVEDYASFLPTNYVDYETRYGSITTHARLNRRLAIWQEGRFLIQPIRSDVLLNDQTGSQIIVGTGGVAFSQVPQDVSYYGTQHKYSVVIGSSKGGNDEAVWFDAKNKAVLRFGSDGTVPISDEFKISSWLNNNLNFLEGKDQTCDKSGEGIHGVYLPNKGQYIFTVRGLNYNTKEKPPETGTTYGQCVLTQYFYTPDNGYPYHELSGDVGTCLYCPNVSAFTSDDLYPNGFGLTTGYMPSIKKYVRKSELHLMTQPINQEQAYIIADTRTVVLSVPFYPNDFYCEYTIIYDTGEASFICFKTWKPRIYLSLEDSCISCHPSDGYNIWQDLSQPQGVRMFFHKQEPKINKFYYTDDNTACIEMNPYVEIILNKDKDITKIPVGVRVQNVQAIDRIEFIGITNPSAEDPNYDPTIGNGWTYLTQSDFTQEGSWWYAPIKYGTEPYWGDPTTGNKRFSGNVIIARVFLNKEINSEKVYSLLKDLVIKYQVWGRNPVL